MNPKRLLRSRICLWALAVNCLAPGSARAQTEIFNYVVTARTKQKVRETTVRSNTFVITTAFACTLFGQPVACVTRRKACETVALDVNESFPIPLSAFEVSSPFITITDPGGHIHWPPIGTNVLVEGCNTGVHLDTKSWSMGVHHTKAFDSTLAWTYTYRFDKTEETPRRIRQRVCYPRRRRT